MTSFLFGKPSQQQQTQTTKSRSDPVLFGPGQLRTPEKTGSIQIATPSILERGLRGIDPAQRERLQTSAFGDIALSEKSAINQLMEKFGQSGFEPGSGVNRGDFSDILEAGIGARGRASTDIEQLLQGLNQQEIDNLLRLLTAQDPFAIAQRTRQEGTSQGTTTGGSKGILDFVNFNVTKAF